MTGRHHITRWKTSHQPLKEITSPTGRHHINRWKTSHHLLEVAVDGLDRVGQHLALCAPNLHALQLVELHPGAHHVHHVVAALHEGVQPPEQAVVLRL